MRPRRDGRPSPDLDEMDVDEWDGRRGSAALTIRSPSHSDLALGVGSAGVAGPDEAGTGSRIPSLVRRPPSPTTSNQR